MLSDIAFFVIAGSILAVSYYLIYMRSPNQTQAQQQPRQQQQVQQPPQQPQVQQPPQQQQRLINRRVVQDDSDGEEGVFDAEAAEQQAKREAKRQRKQQEQQYLRQQNELKEKKNSERNKVYEEREKQRELQEQQEEEWKRKIQEDQQKQEEEVYQKWKDMIVVEEVGTQKLSQEEELKRNQELLEKILKYIKLRKVVQLEEVSIEFSISTQEVIDKIRQLEQQQELQGLIDERGKYIYLKHQEIQSVISYINAKGKISRSDLLKECSRLIKMEPSKQDLIEIQNEKNQLLQDLLPPQFTIKSQDSFPRFKKYIIDTDAGSDDAHAIIVASYILTKYRPDAELIGVTACAGNSSLPNVLRNVHLALRYGHFKEYPKVYSGCEKDILRRFYRDNFFKEDGLGGYQNKYLTELGLQDKDDEYFAEKQHAVDFIRDSVRKYGEDLCIITIGPFTNIFLATQLYPDITDQIGGLFSMGGTYAGVGNCDNAIAEFNINVDVEASAAILHSNIKRKFVLPYDTVLGYNFQDERGHAVFRNEQNTRASKFINDIFEMVDFEAGYYICDQLCIILALLPELITFTLKQDIMIVTDGAARGAMILNYIGRLSKNLPQGKVDMITQIDWQKVEQITVEVNQ